MAGTTETTKRGRLSEAWALILGAIIATVASTLTMYVSNRAAEERAIREARRLLYASFIREMQEMYSAELEVEGNDWLEIQDPRRADLEARRLKIATLGNEILLIGGEETGEETKDFAGACGQLADGSRAKPPQNLCPRLNEPMTPEFMRKCCDKAMTRFIGLARKDLGLEMSKSRGGS